MTKDEALKIALDALQQIAHVSAMDYEYQQWAVEAITAIKEALAQPAVTESHKQEPVTWRYKIVDVFGRPAWTLKTPKSDTRVLESQPLYTTPPPVAEPHKRKPLTDEEIADAVREADFDWHYGWTLDDEEPNRFTKFAHAIEAAHGIKGEA